MHYKLFVEWVYNQKYINPTVPTHLSILLDNIWVPQCVSPDEFWIDLDTSTSCVVMYDLYLDVYRLKDVNCI